MSVYDLKPRFQQLLRPLARTLYRWNMSANQVTLFAFILSAVLGGLLCFKAGEPHWFYLLPLWFFVRMALNAIDGMMAREFGQKSDLGGYLNELTDVVADALLYLPFAFVAPFTAAQIWLVLYLAAMTEMAGILGAVHGNGRRYDGPMGKSDRATLFGLLGVWYAVAGALPVWWYYGGWCLVALLVLTCWRRVQNGLAGPTEQAA